MKLNPVPESARTHSQSHVGGGMRRPTVTVLLALVAVAGAGCGSSGGGSGGLTTVPEGSWAGIGIGLQVSRTTSVVTYGCGSGEIDGPLVLDSTGHFAVAGSTSPGSPIAVVNGPPAATFPTRYTGSTDGQTMQLTTMETLPSGVVTNSYTLTFGKQFNGPLCVR
ncbi:MAG: hypothetical protein M3Y56_11090 [Armatimonadota bacterium]|nr:hypothetical protein [Armatimonadota bacterium]